MGLSYNTFKHYARLFGLVNPQTDAPVGGDAAAEADQGFSAVLAEDNEANIISPAGKSRTSGGFGSEIKVLLASSDRVVVTGDLTAEIE